MLKSVEFNIDWYKNFIENTNEKNLLVKKISDLLEGKPVNSCLEIGLGISPYFAEGLAKTFNRYLIIEKRKFKGNIPKGVEVINADWGKIGLKESFDVIIASHVIYYFEDKKKAIKKMLRSLNKKGRIFFVVNGKSSDYGPLKSAFGEMVGVKYRFTYDDLIKLLSRRKFREYTLPSVIKFDSCEKLFETLRLSFDSYPDEYERMKDMVIKYFKENLRGNKFIIDQKIIEVSLL